MILCDIIESNHRKYHFVLYSGVIMKNNDAQTERKKTAVTRLDCYQVFFDTYGRRKNNFLAAGMMLLAISVFLFLVNMNSLSITLFFNLAFFVAVALFCFILGFVTLHRLNKIKRGDFYITTDHCVDKYQKDYYFRNDEWVLVFSDDQKYKITHYNSSDTPDALDMADEYNRARKHNEYYLFQLSPRKIFYVLPFNKYEFDPDEFETKDGVIYPIKTQTAGINADKQNKGQKVRKYDYKKDALTKSEEQYQKYSKEERDAIDDYRAAIDNLKKPSRLLIMLTSINLPADFIFSCICIVSSYRIAAAVNIVLQTALFVFLCIRFFKPFSHAGNAYMFVPKNYGKLPFLKKKHDRKIGFIFLFLFYFFIYAVLMISMIMCIIK